MEECEALCDRLGIMVNGQFQCMGGTQHLKNKFGQGFTILLKLNTRGQSKEIAKEHMTTVKSVVTSKFQKCYIKDEHKDYVHFHVADTDVTWQFLFTSMELLREQYNFIEDYSVSETTLEQVFLSFAKHQRLESDTSRKDGDNLEVQITRQEPSHTVGSSPESEFQEISLDDEENFTG